MRTFTVWAVALVTGCTGEIVQPGGPDMGDAVVNGEVPRSLVDEPATHARCGWIGALEHAIGVDTFVENADCFDAVHPMWYELGDDAVSVTRLAGANDPRVIEAAAEHGVQLIPMVAGVSSATLNRAMLGDPVKRSQHVAKLVALAVDNGYAGLDIDYEKLWRADDRAGYEAFIAELSEAMHEEGLVISVAAPSFAAGNPNSAFDYAFLAEHLDQIHLMGYDFHTLGTHEGPVAPLGWIEKVAAYASATGRPARFILGLPNYGVTPTWYANSADAAQACGAGYATHDDHMDTCKTGHYAAGRAPHCTIDGERLSFEDTQSLEEKVAAARAAGLGGVTYWTIGGEPPGFFTMVRRYFP